MKVDLLGFLRQAGEQVFGADEREMLYAWQAWLAGNKYGVVVEIDLEAVMVTRDGDALHVEGHQLTLQDQERMGLVQIDEDEDEMPTADEEAVELADLEGRLADRVTQWLMEASDSDAVILQVQPTRPVCALAGQAAASVLLAFERGYRLGGGDGPDG